jgi:SAM-dependent methyltransferase
MPDNLYSGIDNLEVLADAVNYNRFLADAVVRASHGAGTALDFGAGEGTISTATRERGLSVTCIESDPRLRERLRERGFEVHAALGEVVDESQEYIYSLNVLEHIEDDENALAELCSKLRPGGRLFLYVPAHRILFSSMDRKIGHHRRYGRRGLVRIARDAGFVVERAEYADSWGFFATLLYKLAGSREGDLSAASVRFYDSFVFPVSRMMDRIGMSRLFGKNLMVLLRRPPTGIGNR